MLRLSSSRRLHNTTADHPDSPPPNAPGKHLWHCQQPYRFLSCSAPQDDPWRQGDKASAKLCSQPCASLSVGAWRGTWGSLALRVLPSADAAEDEDGPVDPEERAAVEAAVAARTGTRERPPPWLDVTTALQFMAEDGRLVFHAVSVHHSPQTSDIFEAILSWPGRAQSASVIRQITHDPTKSIGPTCGYAFLHSARLVPCPWSPPSSTLQAARYSMNWTCDCAVCCKGKGPVSFEGWQGLSIRKGRKGLSFADVGAQERADGLWQLRTRRGQAFESPVPLAPATACGHTSRSGAQPPSDDCVASKLPDNNPTCTAWIPATSAGAGHQRQEAMWLALHSLPKPASCDCRPSYHMHTSCAACF